MEVRPLPDMARASKPTEYLAASDVRERIRTSNTAKQLGFVIDKAERGKVTLRMPVKALHKQVYGVVHGGVLAALADTAGGLASYNVCPPGGGGATGGEKTIF